jgi:hypothetical protein
MTKLDGTARGGILVAIADRFSLPVHFIGVGEGIDDLEPFERAILPAPSRGTRWRTTMSDPAPKKQENAVKLALEMGPLVLFFLANSKPDLFRPLSGG